MNIGIDISSLVYKRGVSRYTANLVRGLSAEGIDLSLFGYSLRQKNTLKEFVQTTRFRSTVESRILPLPPTALELIWRFTNWQTPEKLFPRMDVFHSWDWMQPPVSKIPVVSTIHDLAVLHYPETAHPVILRQHQHAWDYLKMKAAHLIAVSRATKNDLVELLGYPSYLIHVVHEALPEEFRQLVDGITEEEETAIITRLQLSKPFILFVGTREPRKNLARLIEAWTPLASDFQLIVVGAAGWDGVSENQASDQIRFLGTVSDPELSVLYGQASCFAYPSLYEGFGLPILESFHHGTPVVTSDNSGMREVAGNAAVLVDPLSPESIRQGLLTVLNESIAEQQQRLQRMIIRQHMFDWRRVAQETIAVYKLALSETT